MLSRSLILLILPAVLSSLPCAFATTCATVIARGDHAYAPRRNLLKLARSPFPDEGGWQFGHSVVGSFFDLRVDGRFARVSVSGYDVLGHRPDGVAEVIGRLSYEKRIVDDSGDGSLLEHALTLGAGVDVDFELREENGVRSWFAIFR